MVELESYSCRSNQDPLKDSTKARDPRNRCTKLRRAALRGSCGFVLGLVRPTEFFVVPA